MLAKERAAARGKDFRRRRCCPQRFPKTIDCTSLEIDASKQRSRNLLLAFPQKRMCLLGTLDIARKQNHPRRLNLPKQGSQPRRHLGSIEADD